MSLETRSTSALFKRAEQLKRWQESDTFREPSEPKHKSRKILFTDGCVFLAACAATDKDEVDRLIKRGADIDTVNVDGLTALHQACIDDNLEMVEFLVQRAADINRGDNEGWTPLHATASCGFLSIAKFLLDHGASVSAVNNDGELAIDISESDEMEELLQKEIDKQGVDCEVSRHTEERLMLEDARSWLNSKRFGDIAHAKTGATALHVAAAKGYIKVMGLLVQAGASINSQDLDGWTPLHAAAHWAQREACEILCENFCNMDIKNHVGQTAFDVADPDVHDLLGQLQKKQATMQKDRPDITSLLNRPAVPPALGPNSATSAAAAVASTNPVVQQQPILSSISSTNSTKRRSSITRLSVDDKAQRYKDVSTQEREVLTKASLPETIPEKVSENHSSSSSLSYLRDDNSNSSKIPNFSPPQIGEGDKDGSGQLRGSSSSINAKNSPFSFSGGGGNSSSSTTGDSLDVHPWRRPASLRIRPTTGTTGSSSSSLSHDAGGVGASSSSLSLSSGSTGNRLSPSVGHIDSADSLRRNHSFEDRRKPDTSDFGGVNFLRKDPLSSKQQQQQQNQPIRRSFVPPVRDEESETQRKAHAKRVRETRRSTQGVTLEDLKSAEQLVKKKQQMENQQRTSELQQLVASQQGTAAASSSFSSSATTTTTTSSLHGGSLAHNKETDNKTSPVANSTFLTSSSSRRGGSGGGDGGYSPGSSSSSHHHYHHHHLHHNEESSTEHNKTSATTPTTPTSVSGLPSWKVRVDAAATTTTTSAALSSSNKAKFQSDDKTYNNQSSTSGSSISLSSGSRNYSKGDHHHSPSSGGRTFSGGGSDKSESKTTTTSSPSTLTVESAANAGGGGGGGGTGHHAVTRKKKPKRRSTGVVNFEEVGAEGEDSAAATASAEDDTSYSSDSKRDTEDRSQNGVIDYKKLWEESQISNSCLREDLAKVRDELSVTRKKLDSSMQVVVNNGGLSEGEKKEKRALEKKLSEMEEELKQLEHLKNDNQRLRDENGALIRVISKLSK